MAHYVVRFARHAGVAALLITAALLGTLSGVMFAYAGDLPQISALDNYAPSTITRVYASGGEVIGEFAIQRRLVIGYDEIAPRLREAIIATEDAEFDRHFGLSFPRMLAAIARDIIEWRRAQGASTLTQQLARNLFLTADKSFERKIKEAILTIQIEKRYTKREIFTLYANQVHFGHGAYGVEAAARLYFNKPAKDLNLEEAALIAGIIQRPARQSPYVDLNAALRRRNYSLQRMAEVGDISQADADAAKKRPIIVRGQPQPDRSIAPFFVEEVRKYLEQKYGAKQLYEAGLSVRTAIDVRLQDAANRAVDHGLRQLDKRRGYRKDKPTVLGKGLTVERYQNPRWSRPMAPLDIVPAVVTAVVPASARLRIGEYHADLRQDGFKWTRRTSASDLFKAGDLIDVQIQKLDEASHTAIVSLEQTPLVEGALLAIDNRTGQIRAMVGGFDFDRSKFNRATQAYRQVGSAFKPFVYTTAIDRGYTPTAQLDDSPVTYDPGPGQPPYSPTNYDGKFEGVITLRHALEESRNVPAVRMIDALGPEQVVAYARRFGLESPLPPVLSLALGSADLTLMEMTSAYSVFPNQGVRMRPYLILKVYDRDGNLLEENRPESHDAIRADTAFVMTNLLRGVVQRGTGAAAASLDWPLAGKTGTTDDFGDAWFIGFDPDLTLGVWVGHDERKPLGPSETGAVAALPIWMDFMRAYISTRNRNSPPAFLAPGNIVFQTVNSGSGGTINEAFISGTEPGTSFPRQ